MSEDRDGPVDRDIHWLITWAGRPGRPLVNYLVSSDVAGFQLRFVLIGSLILRGISRFSIFFFLLLRNRTGLFVKVIFTPLDEKPGLSHHCRNKMVLGCDPFFQFAGREHVGLTSRPICSDAPSSNPTTFLNPASPITIRLYGQSIQIELKNCV